MSNPKQPIGCLGLLVVALFLGTFAFVFYRVTSMDVWGAPDLTPQQQRTIKYSSAPGSPKVPTSPRWTLS